MNEEEKLSADRTKIKIDFLKHATSLSTGSIVVVATFFDKFPKPLANAGLLILAVALLSMSLLCSWMEMGFLVFQSSLFPKHGEPDKTLVVLTLLGFYGGTICLGLFAIANIIYRVYIAQ